MAPEVTHTDEQGRSDRLFTTIPGSPADLLQADRPRDELPEWGIVRGCERPAAVQNRA